MNLTSCSPLDTIQSLTWDRLIWMMLSFDLGLFFRLVQYCLEWVYDVLYQHALTPVQWLHQGIVATCCTWPNEPTSDSHSYGNHNAFFKRTIFTWPAESMHLKYSFSSSPEVLQAVPFVVMNMQCTVESLLLVFVFYYVTILCMYRCTFVNCVLKFYKVGFENGYNICHAVTMVYK